MKHIDRSEISYIFSPDVPARCRIRPGETVCFETYDCFTNRFLPEGTTYENTPKCPGNPVTGPLFVEDVHPGDMLKIKIEKIETGPVGIVVVGPKSGCMREKFPEREIRRVHVENGLARFNEFLSLPIKPMIGTIGVAPENGEIPSITPTNHGGNMDCTKIGEGAVLYLPVFCEGGLLSMGDVHALMGDGEAEDCGLEIEAKVTVTVDVVRQPKLSWPLLETEDAWISIASRRTVDEAWQAADRQMFEFMTGQAGIGAYETGMLMTLTGDLVFCQTVNPLVTVRMEMKKSVTSAYGLEKLKEK